VTGDEYKKYTLQARRGIKGEAFFESLVCEYSIPHHVVGPKDVGIDYFCEWVHGDRPTGVLYAVQVKTFSEETAKPKFVRIEKKLNGLENYEIRNPNLRVDESTLRYWLGLGIPVYLFAVVQSVTHDEHGEKERLDCYYKRALQRHPNRGHVTGGVHVCLLRELLQGQPRTLFPSFQALRPCRRRSRLCAGLVH